VNTSRFLFALGFIAVGLIGRVLPHLPNFTPINALVLFGALYLENRKSSFLIVLFTLVLGDFILGFHSTVPYVYGSIALIALMGHAFRDKVSLQRFPLITCASSLLFFVVTNFGVWMTSSLYLKTIQGLSQCYLAALPFLANQMIGDLAYSALLAGYICFVEKICFREKCI